jgi:hypothetical protein
MVRGFGLVCDNVYAAVFGVFVASLLEHTNKLPHRNTFQDVIGID